MPVKRYVGKANGRNWTVRIEIWKPGVGWKYQRPLPKYLKAFNHSPTGFSWGFEGSGPAQLSLAILCDCIGAEEATRNGLYQWFKRSRIATIPQDRNWQMTDEEVRDDVAEIRARHPELRSDDEPEPIDLSDRPAFDEDVEYPPDPPQF